MVEEIVKTYHVAYERDKSGWWVASVRGCHTQGRTIKADRFLPRPSARAQGRRCHHRDVGEDFGRRRRHRFTVANEAAGLRRIMRLQILRPAVGDRLEP